MTIQAKISLVVDVLDELATVGHITNYRHKAQAVELSKEILKDYTLPTNPTKADTTILALQSLAKVKSKDLNRHLLGLTTMAEKALSELRNQYTQNI